MIQATNIHKSFDELEVLKGVNLNVKAGEIVSIVGPSGAGKTTLLQILGTLDKPNKGIVEVDGQDVGNMNEQQQAAFRNRQIGFIFQFHQLLPEFTALENVLIPYEIKNGKADKEAVDKAKEYLKLVGLEQVMNNPATKMSGGQQQRTAIARAMINSPKIILADEPTGNLDSDSTEIIYDVLRNINEKYGTTFVIITHDKRIAEKADRIIEMKDGRINMDIKK